MSDTNKSETIWQRLITLPLKCRELPKKLDFSDIWDDIEHLWQFTTEDGKEWGACIVLYTSGLRSKLEHEVVETPQGVTPKHRVGDYNDHLGFFHTHPLYPDGTEQVGFSEKDFAGALEDGEKLSVVRSGKRVFALVRTERTRTIAKISPKEIKKFYKVFDDYYANDDLPLEKASWLANLDLCRSLGFALYAGEFGQPLRREIR